jgi:DNA repair protein RadC
LIAIICLSCLAGCVFVAQNARAEQESLRRRLRSCESATQLTRDSVEELRTLTEGVAQAQKMARVRRATTHATGSTDEPDPIREPDRWRAWMNAKLSNPTRQQ